MQTNRKAPSPDDMRRVVEAAQAPCRPLLERFLQIIADSDKAPALQCVERGIASLAQLDLPQQKDFLLCALELVGWPEVALEFFCECGGLISSLTRHRMQLFMNEIKAVARSSPAAAIAFLRKESRRGVAFFQELQPTLHLREFDKILELYCTALAGRELVIKSTADAPAGLIRKDHHLPLTDGKAVYLPDDLESDSSAGGFGYYQVLAAHQAGYIEFGTFDFDINFFLEERGINLVLPEKASAPLLISHYELFFGLFQCPQLARDIFFAVEDGRIDCRLNLQYAGLARKLKQVSAESLLERPLPASLPPLEAMVECLIRLSLGEEAGRHLPQLLRPLYNELAGIYEGVLCPSAAVIDSASATMRIYDALQNLANDTIAGMPSSAIPEREEAFPVPGEENVGDGIHEYHPSRPVDFRGQTDPGRVQTDAALDILREAGDSDSQGVPLTPEALKDLLQRGAKIKITGITAEELADTAGLFVTDLEGIVQEKLREITPEEKRKLAKLVQQVKAPKTSEGGRVYFYDEWDYLISDYRPRWCRLREIPVAAATSDIVAGIRKEHKALIASVKRSYQRIRPEMLRKVKRLRDGEEIELDHVIDAVVDRKAGITPSDRIYQNRERKLRDIATCFLLDLSASTDEWVVERPEQQRAQKPSSPHPNPFSFFSAGTADELKEEHPPPEGVKRVIDIEREAVVIIAEALEGLGDEYAIYGFSGYGRDNVELFLIKEFPEVYSERIRRRIGAIEPRKSTRMGPAIRHAIERLSETGKRMKILILLSDGYPQDFDYGPDRASRDYGLHDTMMALREARKKNIHTFCITVDQAGNDYLHEMCGGRDYYVVKKPGSLPKILPFIYRKLTV